ncbi:MAG: hypothetical protein JETT_2766 [Candidatus Jettenia ecosi]|uniref:Uncharacterized protein n=1 Tax=Candidatus Jettenia ecosi TaxID=2494326 RepID=A0A533Q8G3_9BACT|nr:MAG: hypothetical protein JETT_2766 [Candidatus Jettenia ecosi]
MIQFIERTLPSSCSSLHPFSIPPLIIRNMQFVHSSIKDIKVEKNMQGY